MPTDERLQSLLKMLEAEPNDAFCLYGVAQEYAGREDHAQAESFSGMSSRSAERSSSWTIARSPYAQTVSVRPCLMFMTLLLSSVDAACDGDW